MSRQHTAPVLIDQSGSNSLLLKAIPAGGADDGFLEDFLRDLIHDYPESLPIAEIDSSFAGAVSICTELNTLAGPIDNLLVTPSGLPILVECKLWKNPEARRKVVGQILDYAKELSRWSSADLQREVNRRLKTTGNPLLDRVQASHPDVEEIAFNDALTSSLRRGRFLLLIVGDGIREGVEAIAEYLQDHAGLHFAIALVEMPVFALPDGGRLVTPRVLVRSTVIRREVISVPEGFIVANSSDLETALEPDAGADPDRTRSNEESLRFWSEFLEHLRFDDPEQPRPRPSRQGYILLMMPAPGGNCWITVYRSMKDGEVGLTLSSTRETLGSRAQEAITGDWDIVRDQLGGSPSLKVFGGDPRQRINERKTFGNLADAAVRARAFAWLAERANVWVNVLRPRVRAAVDDAASRD